MSLGRGDHNMRQLSPLTYGISLGILSVAVFGLFVLLIFVVCKKRSIEPEEYVLPVKVLPARSYPLADVDAATDGFSRQHLLGEGPRGSVYQAVLATGELVAVKRVHPHLVLLLGNIIINNNAAGSSGGFCATVKSLSWAHHPNVAPIIGYSEGPGERIIITELTELRSLEFHLHRSSTPGFLDWRRRIRIAAEAARGIEYLHEVAMPRLVHGAVKPSNVLIDSSFRARVCDYGLAFLGRPGLEEIIKEEGACMAGDVYGLGLVLLELLSGRRSETGMVIEWALHLIRESRVEELLDPRVRSPQDCDEMRLLVRMGKVAVACVGNCSKSRPSIVQVAAILNSLVAVD